jgi:hypothetical protein
MAVPALVTGLMVTVHSGNTLSGIAAQYCGGQANDWTGIYASNRNVIGSNPNLILPGQKLKVECSDPPQLLKLGSNNSSGKTWGVTYGDPNYCGDGDNDGYDVACQSNHTGHAVTSDPAPVKVDAVAPAMASTYHGSGSMQQCIISRESGGNSQIWNASGHWGLYQFSSSTWAAHGGNPADFGHAGVAEQNSVYYATVAADGYSDWSPYDGCGA